MWIKSCNNVNISFNITQMTSFDEFRNSRLYKGEQDNRFFWLDGTYEINGIDKQYYKVGLCFRNNRILRVELFCANEKDYSYSSEKDSEVYAKVKNDTSLRYKSIEYSYDKRNAYSSIVIVF